MSPDSYVAATYSILGYDPHAQEWGVAVQSKAFAVGAMVPSAQAGVGAVATQAWTNKSFGRRALALLKRGYDPRQVIAQLIAGDARGAQRQLAVIDARGRAANYTGDECVKWAGGIAEQNVSAQGNTLAGERVVQRMRAAFQKTSGKLAGRLLAALDAAQRAGGDTRGQQSAALLVARAKSDIDGIGDVYVDLRVDDHAKFGNANCIRLSRATIFIRCCAQRNTRARKNCIARLPPTRNASRANIRATRSS